MATRRPALRSLRLIVVTTLPILACIAHRADADAIRVFATGGVITESTNTTGNHPVGPTGTYTLRGTVSDNLAKPDGASTGFVPGPYTMPPPAGGASAGPVSVAGFKFTPSAMPNITWGAAFWNSAGSSATLAPVLGASPTENATAIASVTDPATYQFSRFSGSGVVVSVTLDKGLTLVAQGDSESSTMAEIKGTFSTSLLPGDGFLWSFDWKADSSHPDSSTFTFTSNSVLGLDNAAIASAFLKPGGLTEANGIHQEISPFSISATLPVSPAMLGGDGSLTYTLGGTVDYMAATVPEPSTLVLAAMAVVGISAVAVRRRRSESKML
jgi:hypothetical protein